MRTLETRRTSGSATSKRIYTLSEAAEATGWHVMRIRRAEADGLIQPPRRDELGHRVYDDHDIDRLRKLLPSLG